MQLRSADLSGEKKKKLGKKANNPAVEDGFSQPITSVQECFTASEEGETDSRCQSTPVGVQDHMLHFKGFYLIWNVWRAQFT